MDNLISDLHNNLDWTEEALADLMNSFSNPYEIKDQTALSQERCEELWAWWQSWQKRENSISDHLLSYMEH